MRMNPTFTEETENFYPSAQIETRIAGELSPEPICIEFVSNGLLGMAKIDVRNFMSDYQRKLVLIEASDCGFTDQDLTSTGKPVNVVPLLHGNRWKAGTGLAVRII